MTSSAVSEADTHCITSHSADETTRLGACLAGHLEPGDTVLLAGPLGAGKSHLARAIIRSALGEPEAAVPSPSYTLVNVYETARGPVWHADLYRLGASEETDEIGLDDAARDAILLIEWPDRWAGAPARRLDVHLEPDGDERRRISARVHGTGWTAVLACFGAPA